MTIAELWKTRNNYGLFHVQGFDFMEEYEDLHSAIDMNIIALYGSREIDLDLFIENGELPITVFRNLFRGWLVSQKENVQRIYDAISEEFAPLDNYDKHSTITTKFEGVEHDNTINMYVGSESVTNTKSGSESSTMINGAGTTTTTNSNSPEDSSNFYGVNKTETSDGARTDTNTLNFNNREDTSVREFSDDREDSTSNTKSFENRQNVVEEYTHGNIGVIDSATMLDKFLEQRWKLDFYKNLFGRFLLEYTW